MQTKHIKMLGTRSCLHLDIIRKLAHCVQKVADPWVRASGSQWVNLGFIPLVESYQKTSKNGIHSSLVWRSAFKGCCGEQAKSLLAVSLNGTPPPLCGRQVAQTPWKWQNGNSQASADILSKSQQYNSLSREWRINMGNKKKVKPVSKIF